MFCLAYKSTVTLKIIICIFLCKCSLLLSSIVNRHRFIQLYFSNAMASIWSLFSLLSLLLLLDSLAYRQKPNSGRNYGYRSIKKSCIYNNPPNTKTDDSFEVKYDAEFIESLKKKRSYFSILTERLMQTIDDGQVSKKAKDISNLDLNQKREKLLVLGSGWGSYAFLKSVDPTMYDITVISPRNYFTFTPMLAASAVGTVEFRSICEPIRNISPLIKFIEASAMSIDPYKKSLLCQSIKCSGTVCEDFEFDVEYDKLLIAVGSVVNTFGIKGVRDNCQFLKQVEDAAKIRTSLSYCFERASIPNLSDEERKTALTFVIVGAGPTGVELIGELRDWMEIEGRRYFPQLLKYVEIVLVEAGNAVLAVFDNELQKEGLNKLTSTFIYVYFLFIYLHIHVYLFH